MSIAASFQLPTGSQLAAWILTQATRYLLVVGAAGGLFLLGSGVYALLIPAPTVLAPPSVEQPMPLPRPSFGPAGGFGDGVPMASAATSNFNWGLVGLPIFDSTNQKAGEVRDVFVNAKAGTAEGIVISLDGHWLRQKYVYIPFNEVKWDVPKASNESQPARGTVGYSKSDLSSFKPMGHPLLPRGEVTKPGGN